MNINALAKPVNAAEIAPERLANNPALSERQKISEASRQFEAILLRQILSATQKPVIPSKFADNSTASQIYRDMVTDQLADHISKSGAFGLARIFEQQLNHAETSGAGTGPATATAASGRPSLDQRQHALERPASGTTAQHSQTRPRTSDLSSSK